MIKSNLFTLIVLSAILLCASGCTFNFPLFSEEKPLEETKLEGEGKYKILILDISGVIVSEEAAYVSGLVKKENTVSLVKEILTMAKEDDRIKAVVLRIDSPGGTVTASDIIYREILKFKKETRIPVYASMMDVAASGALYIAMACDGIYANPTTVTGSIGVIFQNIDLTGLLDKLGIKDRTVKSGEKKDMGSPLRSASEEELKIMKDITLDLYGEFLNAISAGRPKLARAEIERLADGRIYSSRQALNAGLIDGISYLDEVIEKAKKNANLEKARVVMYQRPESYRNNIYSLSQSNPLSYEGITLFEWRKLSDFLSPKFMYIWEPGIGILP